MIGDYQLVQMLAAPRAHLSQKCGLGTTPLAPIEGPVCPQHIFHSVFHGFFLIASRCEMKKDGQPLPFLLSDFMHENEHALGNP